MGIRKGRVFRSTMAASKIVKIVLHIVLEYLTSIFRYAGEESTTVSSSLLTSKNSILI